MPVAINDHVASSGQTHYIINTSVKDFRAVAAEVNVDEHKRVAVISQDVATALNVREGEAVRFSSVAFCD